MAVSTSRDGDDRSGRSGGTARLFVGRARELSELTAGLDEAVSGRGSLFLLSGDPGIGKTRLAKEVADLAARREARVLWGHPWEGGGQPAYWPWVQILRSYVRSEDPAVLAQELGGGAGYVSQLVPELDANRSAAHGPAAARLDSNNARFYLFDSITEFLRNGAERHPLVIVLDDLHAADLPSLLMLQFLAAELDGTRILVIGTYRGGKLGAPPKSPLCSPISREGAGASRSGASQSATSHS